MKGPPESSGFGPSGSAGARGTSRENRSRRGQKRLRHADFQRVYQQGRRHFAGHMTVFFLVRDWGKGARVGFTVGRVLGNAVERNRIRRRLREAVRTGAAGIERAVDVVINPKKSALTAEFGVLRKEVCSAFEKIQSSVVRRQSSGEEK